MGAKKTAVILKNATPLYKAKNEENIFAPFVPFQPQVPFRLISYRTYENYPAILIARNNDTP
jgi:hypothetical protein